MAITVLDLETELSSVNSILGAIGQAPVTDLDYGNPEVAIIWRALQEVSTSVQNEGWVFNREQEYPLLPDSDKFIRIPNDVLRMDISPSEGPCIDPIKRDGRLYDRLNHTFEFDRGYKFDIVWKFPFDDLPSCFKQYITFRAARQVAAKLVSSPELFQMLQDQEGTARAVCMEYECLQGDYSYFGFRPNEYRGYQPYLALTR